MSIYLGIDLGTSSVKAVLIEDSGQVIAQATSDPLKVDRPLPGWSEQNPAEWWSATQQAVLALPAALRSGIRAIGLSGQMHGAVCLDAYDAVIRPAILWNDARSALQCQTLEFAVPSMRQITGNAAMAGFTAPKLLWMREHEPDAFARIATILLPKDWLRLVLCGVKISDPSDSAGTLWLDIKNRTWSDAMLAATGLTREHMPELAMGNQQTGLLHTEIATAWGMDTVPIAAGAGDNVAGAVGIGAVQDGEGFVSLGTSGVVFVADDAPRLAPDHMVHAFCHTLPGLWHRMGVTLSAASAIDWAAKAFGFGKASDLFDAIESLDNLGHGPLMLPYLDGSRTPHNNPALRGQLVGLGVGDGPQQIAAAVLEGVSYALSDSWNALSAAGPVPKTLSVIGGGARSDLWCTVLASIFGVTLNRRDAAQAGPAVGAARLARLCLGESTIDEVCPLPPVERRFDPDPHLRDRLLSRQTLFSSLHDGVREAAVLMYSDFAL